jgi:hypothetical protein
MFDFCCSLRRQAASAGFVNSLAHDMFYILTAVPESDFRRKICRGSICTAAFISSVE